MTNERMFGLFSRTLMVPVGLLFLGVGCYSLFLFWQQEVIAKELYHWEPVIATNYEIRELDSPGWPTENTSLGKNSEAYQEWEDELYDMRKAMQAASQNEYTIKIAYQYKYAGEVRNGTSLSPFPELYRQALRDPQLHRYLLREDHPLLTVYVDPDDSGRSALVRGWSQGNRWGALVIGGFLVPISLAILYFLVRPIRRVEDLFK
jgi:hypothetical protein